MGTLNIQKPPEKSPNFCHSSCRLHRLSLTYLRLSHQEGKKKRRYHAHIHHIKFLEY